MLEQLFRSVILYAGRTNLTQKIAFGAGVSRMFIAGTWGTVLRGVNSGRHSLLHYPRLSHCTNSSAETISNPYLPGSTWGVILPADFACQHPVGFNPFPLANPFL